MSCCKATFRWTWRSCSNGRTRTRFAPPPAACPTFKATCLRGAVRARTARHSCSLARHSVEESLDYRYYIKQGRPMFAFEFCRTVPVEELPSVCAVAYSLAIESFLDSPVVWFGSTAVFSPAQPRFAAPPWCCWNYSSIRTTPRRCETTSHVRAESTTTTTNMPAIPSPRGYLEGASMRTSMSLPQIGHGQGCHGASKAVQECDDQSTAVSVCRWLESLRYFLRRTQSIQRPPLNQRKCWSGWSAPPRRLSTPAAARRPTR